MIETDTLPVVWLFGLPSSGKTTLANLLRAEFAVANRQAVLIDGDELRKGLCDDLGFSDNDRAENIRRAAQVAKLLRAQGLIVICAFITPLERHRAIVRQILGDTVHLTHVSCPLGVCVARDVKGLYKKAAGEGMRDMTGTQQAFEAPLEADSIIDTHGDDISSCVRQLVANLAGVQGVGRCDGVAS